MNPFIFGSVVTGKNFVNRQDILKNMKETCGSGQNVLIYGERRIGKTSLIMELLNKTKIPAARVDLLGVTSVQDFCERYVKAVENFDKINFIKKIGKLLSLLRPKISFSNEGNPEISLFVEELQRKDSLIEALELPVKLLSKNQPAIIILDEFQDILKISELKNFQAIMRGTIQHHENISYIFLGSRKNILLDMFRNKKNPFYNSAKIIPLDKIEQKYFIPYIIEKFKSGKRTITTDIIVKICDSADNIPNDIQRLCHAIWEITESGTAIDESILKKGIIQVCSYQRDLFEELFRNLSKYQAKLLIALAKGNTGKISGRQFIESNNLSSSATVYKSLNTLLDRELLLSENEEYKIAVPFFKYWLLNRMM